MLELKEIMHAHGLDLDDDQCALLLADLTKIIEVNRVINLTRIDSIENGIVRHLEDSLLGLSAVNAAPAGLYGDLGTGGGFPGVPIAIMTGRETLLVDSVKKKVNALLSVVETLGLDDHVSGYAGRIEDLAVERKGQFSVLTARALSSLPSLLELSAPLLRNGGQLICYKAKPEKQETDAAISLEKKLGMRYVSRETYQLSDESTRCILVFEKYAKPKISLPRRLGMAQKHPLA